MTAEELLLLIDKKIITKEEARMFIELKENIPLGRIEKNTVDCKNAVFPQRCGETTFFGNACGSWKITKTN